MKLFLKKIIFFIPFLLIAYLFVLFIAACIPSLNVFSTIKTNTGGPGQTLLRLREARQVRNVDVLFIGSSHANKGFDTRLFERSNISAFNLGSGLQTPQNSYYLLKEYVPLIHPKKIVMELYWDVLEYEDGTEACIDITSNSPLSAEIIKMNLSTQKFILINSMLAHALSMLVKPVSTIDQKMINGETYISGGYLESKHNPDHTRKSLASIKPHKVILQEKQLDYLKKIIAYCTQIDIPLLFVTAPVPEEFLTNVTNYSSIKASIEQLIHFHQFLWINFNDTVYRSELQLNSNTDFDDANHLSQKGVYKFNTLLIPLLK